MFNRTIFHEAIILWQKKFSKFKKRKKIKPLMFKNKRLFFYILIHVTAVSVYNRFISFKNGLI